jgi:hypothetical protein
LQRLVDNALGEKSVQNLCEKLTNRLDGFHDWKASRIRLISGLVLGIRNALMKTPVSPASEIANKSARNAAAIFLSLFHLDPKVGMFPKAFYWN